MKIPAESVMALKQFGYTEREAEFLYLVAVHSGFFLQRQFTQFVDVAGRGPATYFIKKAIQKQHVREYLPERGTQKIYHLFSRSVYAAIGKENSRHRRPGRYGLLDKAAVRLLSLDFVLANPGRQYLEEEADKVDYLTVERRISKDVMPAKVFRGDKGSETRRYFFENFPMFLSQDGDSTIVTFTYIEDDIRSLQTFTSFVQRYRPLFEALGDGFKVIFVSNSTQSFQFAHETFVRSLSATQRGRECQQLARFFRLRRMAEEKRFRELAHKDVIDWQRGLKLYSDAEHESQYRSWKQTGKLLESEAQILAGNPGQQFETFLAVPNVVRLGASAIFETAQPTAQLPADRRPNIRD
jgi:hypothetical protein